MNCDKLLNELFFLKRQIYTINILAFIIIALGYFIEVILADKIENEQITYIEIIYEFKNIGFGMLFSGLVILGYYNKMLRKCKKHLNKT